MFLTQILNTLRDLIWLMWHQIGSTDPAKKSSSIKNFSWLKNAGRTPRLILTSMVHSVYTSPDGHAGWAIGVENVDKWFEMRLWPTTGHSILPEQPHARSWMNYVMERAIEIKPICFTGPRRGWLVGLLPHTSHLVPIQHRLQQPRPPELELKHAQLPATLPNLSSNDIFEGWL